MPYVIETRPGGSQILQDVSARELRESRAKWEPEGFSFRPVDAATAHRWVKAGGLHGTDLYIRHDGRIGKAGAGC